MPTGSIPKSVDCSRQQLTTGTEMRKCLLMANPSVLMAHANNSQQVRSAGMSIGSKSNVVDGPHQQLTSGTEMPMGSKPKCVDGLRHQLTTGTKL